MDNVNSDYFDKITLLLADVGVVLSTRYVESSNSVQSKSHNKSEYEEKCGCVKNELDIIDIEEVEWGEILLF